MLAETACLQHDLTRLKRAEIDQLNHGAICLQPGDQRGHVLRQARALTRHVEVAQAAVEQPAVVDDLRRAQRQLYQRFRDNRVVLLPVVYVHLSEVRFVFTNEVQAAADLCIGGGQYLRRVVGVVSRQEAQPGLFVAIVLFVAETLYSPPVITLYAAKSLNALPVGGVHRQVPDGGRVDR